MRRAMERGSREELAERLALCGPEHTVRGFFFTGALEAVRALGGAGALARCVEAAGDEPFLTFFHYPVAALNRLLYVAAWSLSETCGGFDAAMRHLGERVAPEYLGSGAGRVLVMLAGGEPKRMLDGLPAAFRTSIRHGDCTVRWVGPQRAVIVIQGTTVPPVYFEGSVRGVFITTRLARVTTVERSRGLTDSEIEVSWEGQDDRPVGY